MQNINLTIDHIALKGDLGRRDRAEHIGRLLEQELHRRLSLGGLPEGLASGEIARLDVSPIQLPQAYGDEHLARALAESIVLGLQENYR
jgi:hypothetical protein